MLSVYSTTVSSAHPPIDVVADVARAPIDETELFVRMRRPERLLVLVSYVGYFACALVLAATSPSPGIEWLLLALAGFLVVRVAPLLWWRRSFAWFHPFTFLVVIELFRLTRRVGVYGFGLAEHRALPGFGPGQLNHLLAYELVLLTLGLAAYYLGALVLPAPRAPQLVLRSPRHLRLKLLAVVAISTAVFLVYIGMQGGLGAQILSWRESRHVSLAGEFYIINLINVASAACLVWLALEPGVWRSPLFWATSALALTMMFLSTGSRGMPVQQLIIGACLVMLTRRRITYLSTALILIFSMALVGMLVGLRSGNQDVLSDVIADTTFAESIDVAKRELIERSSVADGTLPILARVPDDVDFLYGSSYAAALLVGVPRALWPDKPKMIGGQVAEVFFRGLGGVPPGPIGEAYWNFHVAGVVICFALFGIWHRWLARLYARNHGAPGALLFVIAVLMCPSPASVGLVAMLQSLVPVTALLWLSGAVRLRERRG